MYLIVQKHGRFSVISWDSAQRTWDNNLKGHHSGSLCHIRIRKLRRWLGLYFIKICSRHQFGKGHKSTFLWKIHKRCYFSREKHFKLHSGMIILIQFCTGSLAPLQFFWAGHPLDQLFSKQHLKAKVIVTVLWMFLLCNNFVFTVSNLKQKILQSKQPQDVHTYVDFTRRFLTL